MQTIPCSITESCDGDGLTTNIGYHKFELFHQIE